MPKYNEIAAVLSPKVEGDRLVLVLNQQNQGVEKLLSLVMPSIETARASAMRIQLTEISRMIGLAMHNYAHGEQAFALALQFRQGRQAAVELAGSSFAFPGL